jgi:outer membrane murein-binding lipoprotein Lpp
MADGDSGIKLINVAKTRNQLQAEIAAMRAEMEQMRTENAAMREENARAREERAADAERHKREMDVAANDAMDRAVEKGEGRIKVLGDRLEERMKALEALNDQLVEALTDEDGDGIPDAFQTGTDIAVSPVTAPALAEDKTEEIVQRIFDRVIETLKIWLAEGGAVPVHIPANDEGGLSFREGSPAVVSGKKMRKILELAIRADANSAALQPMVFRTRDAFVAYMEERDEDLREALEGTWEAEDAFDEALAAEVERRLTVAEEEGLV